MTFWRPFCLCKLGGQDLKILLGNRIFGIQHTQIRLKSLFPNFYSKMLLTFTFPRNPTRLWHLHENGLETYSSSDCTETICILLATKNARYTISNIRIYKCCFSITLFIRMSWVLSNILISLFSICNRHRVVLLHANWQKKWDTWNV